ncbi:MAG: type sorting protein, partial [Bacteroidota bacterium]|nr:type sorting protein [Bacteroidota bacterium]
MIKKYPLLSLVSLITLLFAAVDLSAQAGTHKATFAQKDIMGSAAFIQNNQLVGDFNGQKILYFTHHDNINAFFTANGLVYKVNKIDEKKLAKREKEEREKAHEKRKEGEDEGEEAIPVKATTFAMEWVGANPHAVIESAQKKDGYYSYIKKEGNSTKSVITDGFKTLTYKELYPGIDVVYSFPEKGGVKYNLVVHPGADISQVKMTWSGIRSLKKDVDGNLLVHAHNGDIMEHAPVSFATGHVVATEYEIKGNTVQFRLPQGYNKNEVLTIDPWVTALTTLPPSNVGFDVDYDFLGNLFVYGTGQVDIYDLSSFCQITKYNSAGVALWTFSGQITTPINWTSGDVNDNINYPSNMIVDKSNGKAYTGQGYFFGGATVVRLNPAGQYDNFISAVDPNFQEVWCFAYNCLNASVLALGGGTTSNVNMAIINTTSGSTTTTNISGISSSTGNFQDIVCGTYDTAGSLYVMMNDGLGILPYTNTIYKVNSAFNGNIWATNSNYSCFGELRNAPFWSANGGGINCNGNNCLSANGSYLFYYDGNNIAAHDLVSGNTVGTSYHINNYDSLMQGGIAVDNCNHVYVGGVGVIKTFTFNGSNFTPGADIPLGGAFSN